jgi:hypothetical protein
MSAMDDANRARWGVIRWGWFAIALVALLGTPHAAISAFHMGASEHKLAAILAVALAIRLAIIWFLLALWWKFRPSSQQPGPVDSN